MLMQELFSTGNLRITFVAAEMWGLQNFKSMLYL